MEIISDNGGNHVKATSNDGIVDEGMTLNQMTLVISSKSLASSQIIAEAQSYKEVGHIDDHSN